MLIINRRYFISAIASLGLSSTMIGRVIADDNSDAIIWGPPATPSIIPAYAVAKGMLSELIPNCQFKVWNSPDQIRAGLISGRIKMAIMPSYTGANLFNKGVGLRLANILTDGLLYIVAGERSNINNLDDLKGKRLAVPFKNDMPDLVLQGILAANGISEGTINLTYVGNPAEAIPLLMLRRVDAAVLVEPACTAAIAMSANTGNKLKRVINLQDLWRSVSGDAMLPQAGLLLGKDFDNSPNGEKTKTLNKVLEKAKTEILTNPEQAAQATAGTLDFSAILIGKAIPTSNLVVRSGRESRSSLEKLFNVLMHQNPEILGGKLPSDEFYSG